MSQPLFLIGSKGKQPEEFFTLLRDHRVKTVIDVRLSNNTLYAGFTKCSYLPYFLQELCNAEHRHIPECAPDKALLDDWKAKRITWGEYEQRFLPIIQERHIERLFTLELLDHACLLCAEPTADQCHRRLVAEYLQRHFDGLEIVPL